jgi:PIN domain nuclease of toxin-antitoxin system
VIRVVADTHAILWYLFDDPRLSANATAEFDHAQAQGEQIAISAITLAEIVYLIEKDKIAPVAFDRIVATLMQPNATLVEIPFNYAIARAMRQIDRTQIPDLPDRIVAATAIHARVPIISRDNKIRSSTISTIW